MQGLTKSLVGLLPVLLLILSLAAPAFGNDVSDADRAAASTLFDEAGRLFDEGKTAEALAKYQAAHRLEPTAGTLLNIARCHEKLGRFASAWGAVDEAESMARKKGDETRRAYAAQWKTELKAKLAHLRIDVAAGAEGARIRLDGKVLAPGALSAALPVDPGAHTVDVEMDGKPLWHIPVHIEPKPGTTAVRVPAPPARPFWNGQRIAGLAVGGVGIAGIVVGSVFGVRAANLTADSEPHCVDLDPDPCDREGVALRDRATTAAWVSNIAIGAGVAAVAGGVVLFLTAPSSKAPEPATAARLELRPVAGPAIQGMLMRASF